jgi:hypothetical protein
MIALDFGCLPTPLNLKAGEIAIITRLDLADSIGRIEQSGRVHEGWIYPTLPTLVGNRYEPFPYPEPRYVLPLTHTLRHEGAATADQLHFLINATGFLLGFRLLPDGHGHLQRTPIRCGLTTDLGAVSARELAFCLPHIDRTWSALPSEQRLCLSAVITAYQTAAAYRQRFEQFTFLYSALDAIWRFHRIARGLSPRGGIHSERPQWLCREVLGIPVPEWAHSTVSGSSDLADARNLLTHEALYGGAPLGHAASQEALIEVQALVSRAVIKALAIPCGYVSSPATSQQMQSLALVWSARARGGNSAFPSLRRC